ncbi:MAG TPA: hypothetical protein VHE13_18005 [Opitutus sp.]|nr:hypothetical protein [Opitutus sp.]
MQPGPLHGVGAASGGKRAHIFAFALWSLAALSADLRAGSDYATPYTFTTLAGLPPGSADGAGRAAGFTNPQGLAVDGSGNVYVADTANHTIRKITPAAVVTTLAGAAGMKGSADGAGGDARFYGPQYVAVDSAGNVYVSDTGNNTVRKITPAGAVTTLAGSAGHSGSTDATGTEARFNYPAGLAVDATGNVFVADSFNTLIRKITPAGAVTTLAGAPFHYGSADGTGAEAQFLAPQGLAIDNAGNLYAADDNAIRRITPAGVVTTLAGLAGAAGSTDGTGSAARFVYPTGVAVDVAGNVYVTDERTIRRVTSAGVVTTLAGNANLGGSTDGAGAAALFEEPQGIAVDATGNLYVADTDNSTIRKITSGAVVATIAGEANQTGSADGTGRAARFDTPYGVAVDGSGNVYVADSANSTIRKITPLGAVTTLAGTAGDFGGADGTGGAAQFIYPSGLAADSAGNVYVADTNNNVIRKITPAGVVTTMAGVAGFDTYGSADGKGSAARFHNPQSVAVDGAGNVYVADSGNDTIRKITPAGEVTTLAGQAGTLGGADGTGGTARFNYPRGVAADGAGNIYVADSGNHAIRKITPAGVVTTPAGSTGYYDYGSTDGTGSEARFNLPSGVAVDGAGNLFVTDYSIGSILGGGHPYALIRKITAAGVVTTVAGTVDGAGSADGTGSAARFDAPGSIAVDGAGNLYVADTGNSTIRKGSFISAAPQILIQPASVATAAGENLEVAVTAVSSAPLTYVWRRNGIAVPGGTGDGLDFANNQPVRAGIYDVVVATNVGSVASTAAIVGVLTTSGAIGDGRVLATEVPHPNGNHYDQVLLTGPAAAVATQGGRVTRTSFIDENDDIVQVEFAGHGTLALVLDDPSGPAPPVNYEQSSVSYMKGHVGLVIAGADETTNVLVFTVGRATAFDLTGHYNILLAPSTPGGGGANDPATNGSPLFAGHADTVYDGVADLSFIAIESTNGKFGGLRAADARFSAVNGLTGVYAPGVAFQGPVFIGDIDAGSVSGTEYATPAIIIGSTSDARITGGDLFQTNGQPVRVHGLTQLKFTAGSDSGGHLVEAMRNRAVLEDGGADVTSKVVVDP